MSDRDRAGRAPIHLAALANHVDALDLLMSAGADPDSADNQGFTALHFAAQEGNVDIAKRLLRAGCTVDAANMYGNTPLFTAVFSSNGDGELIRLLRQHGADPHQRNHTGVSPVALARLIANVDVRQHFADLA